LTEAVPGGEGAAGLLRRALIGLALLAVGATAVELASQRHWNTPLQLIPWIVLGVLTLAIVVLLARPNQATLRVVRGVAVVVLAATAYGIFVHVHGNYEAGPLDIVYGPKWDTLSEPSRWWASMSGGVGPSPPLAPGVLAQAALCLLFATIRHPALGRRA
jgi:hypothetical protein